MKRTRLILICYIICAQCIITYIMIGLLFIKCKDCEDSAVPDTIEKLYRKINNHDYHNQVSLDESDLYRYLQSNSTCRQLFKFLVANFTIDGKSTLLYVKDSTNDTTSRKLMDKQALYAQSIAGIIKMTSRLKPTVFVDVGSGLGEYTLAAAMNNMKVISVGLDQSDLDYLCLSVSNYEHKDRIKLVKDARRRGNSTTRSISPLSYLMSSPGIGTDIWFNFLILRLNVNSSLYKIFSRSLDFFESIKIHCIFTKWVNEDASDALKFLRSRHYVPFFHGQQGSDLTRLNTLKYLHWPEEVLWIKQEKLEMHGYFKTNSSCRTLSKFSLANFTVNGESITIYIKDPNTDTTSMKLVDDRALYSKYIDEAMKMMKRLGPKYFVDIDAGLGEYSIAAAVNNISVISVGVNRSDMDLRCLSVSNSPLRDRILLIKDDSFERSTINSTDQLLPPLSYWMTLPGIGLDLWFNPLVLRINVNGDLFDFLNRSNDFFDSTRILGILTKWMTEDTDNAFQFLQSRNFVPYGFHKKNLKFIRLQRNNLFQWPEEVAWMKSEKLERLGFLRLNGTCDNLSPFFLVNYTIDGKSMTLYVKDPKSDPTSFKLLDKQSVYYKSVSKMMTILNRLGPAYFVDIGSGLGEYTIASATSNMTVLSVGLDSSDVKFLCLSVANVKPKDRIVLIKADHDKNDQSAGNLATSIPSISHLMMAPEVRLDSWHKPLLLRLNIDGSLFNVLSRSQEFFDNAKVLGILTKWIKVDAFKSFRFLRSRSFVPYVFDRVKHEFVRLDGHSYPTWPEEVAWLRHEQFEKSI